MVCCIAAAFVFGLIVKTLQTLFRRRQGGTDVHPTPVRRVADDPGRTATPDDLGHRESLESREPVASGV